MMPMTSLSLSLTPWSLYEITCVHMGGTQGTVKIGTFSFLAPHVLMDFIPLPSVSEPAPHR